MNSATLERESYIARTKQARESEGDLRQEDVASYIGVDRPTYTNYESRRAMPQKYIPKFCEITQVRIDWLLTGRPPMKNSKDQALSDVISETAASFKDDAFISPLLQSLAAAVKEREKK